MKARSKLHTHICMKCSIRGNPVVWEHDAPECFVPHPTEKNCPKCSKGGESSPKDFWHDHYCKEHNHMWDHADKACLLKKDADGIPDIWTLNCPGRGQGKTDASGSFESEGGGTAEMSRPKPALPVGRPKGFSPNPPKADGRREAFSPKTATCPNCGTQAQWVADAS